MNAEAPPDSSHVLFMREAIRLARENLRAGAGGPFGAVVVKDGAIIGRGRNQVTSINDPTAHAEVMAIREACRVVGDFRLSGAVIYTSCEPCPMCLSALYWARIERVFFAGTREDAAAAGFDDEMLYREVALPLEQRALPFVGLLREEALPAFIEWRDKTDKVPY
jgi:tRNA(Arg) A34 adenosine deaminase TadA